MKKIKNTKIFKNITKLRKFLEMIQYYQQYINSYTDIAELLYDMLKKDKLAVWGQIQ